MRAIIVSGMPAVGKTTVARIVGKDLEIPVVGGGDVLKEMAVEEGYTPGGEDWWDTSEGMKFLEERKKSSGFDKEVDSRLLAKVEEGNVIITSYPIPWLAKGGLKVWLSGTVGSRAKRMSKRDHISIARCQRVLKKRDEENARLYMKIYGIDFGVDMTPFDLVVDTETISEEMVATVIVEFAKNRSS